MYVAKHDVILHPEDSAKLKDVFHDRLVNYHEIDGGHIIFFVAKDISFITEHILPEIKQYNPLPWE